MAQIRVLANAARPMQRLGYLKRLVRRVTVTSTSSLDNLGRDLIDTVSRKVTVPLNEERALYIKRRLYDRIYASLKSHADTWLSNGAPSQSPPTVAMELQDLYLADQSLPSQVGKLVSDDWSRYPPLAVSLGLIRAGTYSANTRALSLLHLTPEDELKAFQEYDPKANPMRVNRHQALLLLYSFLDADGDVLALLWSHSSLREATTFTDRDVGNLLADIYRRIIERHRGRVLSADERSRLVGMERSAARIAQWRDQPYSGKGANLHAGTVRVEPYVDLGLLSKPDPFQYEYTFSPAGRIWLEALAQTSTGEEVTEFLGRRFFSTAAHAWGIYARSLSSPEDIVPHLRQAWRVIRSPGGYAPIEEMALLAGIDALLEHSVVIEPMVAREALIAYQKANPYEVRFTVNRLGALAYARFLEMPQPALRLAEQ
ncbi:MAG: hypothetical protein ACUVWR_16740 [Anaerolineae bacterium]